MGRQSCDTRKLEGGTMDQGNLFFGGHEALVVFDDVFVPWDRVFMFKEYAFSRQLVELICCVSPAELRMQGRGGGCSHRCCSDRCRV